MVPQAVMVAVAVTFNIRFTLIFIVMVTVMITGYWYCYYHYKDIYLRIHNDGGLLFIQVTSLASRNEEHS